MKSHYKKNHSKILKKNDISKEDIIHLSKCRIIQKNLVHFYGFPDYLYKKEILFSPEYFGQYGVITKIILVSKKDKLNLENHNSAYITFLTKEQASYAILAVDSIKINDQLVRAFFGTSKYCSHFLNNRECTCEDNCMFLHHLADKNDIIDENSKFGYSDHIKLAKKIINFGSYNSKYYVKCNKYPFKTFLPNIETIYFKENIIIKTKNHRRNVSDVSNKSTSSDDNDNNNQKSSNEDKSNNILIDKLLLDNSNINNDNTNTNNNINYNIVFKSKIKSRFFDNNSINNNYKYFNNNEKIFNNDNYKLIIDTILTKFPLYSRYPLNNYINKIKNEYNFCLKLYNKTNDLEVLKLIEEIY
jgi:CCR4-NOT transcription complex subunit 4